MIDFVVYCRKEACNTVTTSNENGVDRLVIEASKNFRGKYAEWFKGMSQDQIPVINFIMVGLEKQNNAHQVRTYLLSSQANFSLQLATDGCMLAGVVQYAIYLKHRFYDVNMGLEQAMRLAVYLITETATQDPKVGGPIRAAQITGDGFSQLSDEQVSRIIQENEEQNKTLKSFFMK